jgi:hypothetical protein
LKIEATYGFHQNSAFQVGYRMPKNSSQAFDCRNPIIRRDLEKDFRTSTEKQIANEGYRSLCSVPLIVRNNCIGVVTVVSKRRNQFLVRHSQLVQEMSNQIALAILSMTLTCPSHPGAKLLCPRCIGATGGRTTVSKHHGDLSNWGKKGGRGRKKQES